MYTAHFSDRRSTARFEPGTLCYVRVFCRRETEWVVYDGLILDVSETRVRVCSDMPLASEFRIAYYAPDDVRRAIESRGDASGVVFEIGDPVAQPRIGTIENDFSFLEPLYGLLTELV